MRCVTFKDGKGEVSKVVVVDHAHFQHFTFRQLVLLSGMLADQVSPLVLVLSLLLHMFLHSLKFFWRGMDGHLRGDIPPVIRIRQHLIEPHSCYGRHLVDPNSNPLPGFAC